MKILDSIKDVYQNHKEQSRLAELFKNTCKDNKKIAVDYQKEIETMLSCPLCKSKDFYTNLYLFTYGYNGSPREINYMNSHYTEEFGPTDACVAGHSIKVKYKVCKKCGYILPFIDMDSLDGYNFRPEK